MANVVIGLWDPTRYNEEVVPIGQSKYDITQLRTWFVSGHVLKHRDGSTNKRLPFRFLGATSMFEEFPERMTPQDYTRLTKY